MLSVIVPAYNSAATLPQCIESIATQQVEAMEMIIVDDGSTDNTHATALSLGEKYRQVRVLSQLNQGLSAARNAGINIARGDIITFVDSDDTLMPGTYKPLLDLLNNHAHCHMLEFSLVRTMPDGAQKRIVLADNTYVSPRDYWLRDRGYEHCYACNKLFRRSVFFDGNAPKLRFTTGRVFEDVDFMQRFLATSPVIITSSHCGYNYSFNPHGITAKADGRKLQMLLDSLIASAKVLKLSFAEPTANIAVCQDDEVAFYMHTLNMQITVCRQLHTAPVLPSAHINLRAITPFSPTVFIKAAVQNLLGVRGICRLWKTPL